MFKKLVDAVLDEVEEVVQLVVWPEKVIAERVISRVQTAGRDEI